MDPLLTRLSHSLHQAQSQEELVRPLLEMLEQVTQLESTYLTRIDLEQDLQHVLYARNTRQMLIPEGLSVPWQDTLCRRALSEGRMCTTDVAACWGDSQAARGLGIQTYVSAPVRMSDGHLYGTLCAASAQTALLPPDTESVLQLFAKLIAQHVEREQLLQRLQAHNAQLAHQAFTDPLTQLPNRAALREELQRLLARAQRTHSSVLVAFIDLDGFKAVNDRHGHAVGDLLLRTLAQQLQHSLRAGDMVARMGGDEFVVVTPVDGTAREVALAQQGLEQRLRAASVCDLVLPQGATCTTLAPAWAWYRCPATSASTRHCSRPTTPCTTTSSCATPGVGAPAAPCTERPQPPLRPARPGAFGLQAAHTTPFLGDGR